MLICKAMCVLLMDVLVQVKKKIGYYWKDCQTFAIEKNWRFQKFDLKDRKENLKKCTSFE